MRQPSAGPRRPTLPFGGRERFSTCQHLLGGAYLTCYLGAFGADVIKVESIQRPDGFRYSGAYAQEGDDWYERSPVWQATNLNKRDITLDLTSEPGATGRRRLVGDADVVVENFSPRVVEQFGLDYDSLAQINPDVIMVRMPGFGLEDRGEIMSAGHSTSSSGHRNVRGHRLSRRAAVQSAGTR